MTTLGPPTADRQKENLIANPHLSAPVGDFKVVTAAGVRGHRFVKRDTSRTGIQATTTGDVPLGEVTHRCVDYEKSPTANFVVGDILHVEAGHGTIRKVVLQSGSAAVVVGDELTTGTAGTLKKRAAITVAAGATPVTSTAANGAILAGGSLPEPLVAYAMDDKDPAAADTDCSAKLAI